MRRNPMKSEVKELALTKEELAALPAEEYKHKIIVVDNPEHIQETVEYLSRFEILGFDTETKPSFKKGKQNKVSLLQLATDECAYLFRLNKIGLPEELEKILENTEILKIGLSLKDDFAALNRLRKIEYNAFVELQNLAQKFNIKNRGLRGIYGVLFGKKISKAQRLSNWEADTLSNAQQEYAALDAWASLQIYRHFANEPYPFKLKTKTDQ